MSPQMNGEPRDGSAAANPGSATVRPPASVQGDRPLLEPINTDGVIQTTVSREDAKLAPLFTQEATADFRSPLGLGAKELR